jgi:hypothetical protein
MITACAPRNTSATLFAVFPSTVERAIGTPEASNSKRGATESFMTSFNP